MHKKSIYSNFNKHSPYLLKFYLRVGISLRTINQIIYEPMKVKYTILAIFIFFTVSHIQAQIYSFEDGLVPTGWTASSGSLTTSTAKYKLGTTSLSWTWQAGSKLTAVAPSNLSTASTSSSGGIYFWYYNTQPTTSNLILSFQNTSGQTKCSLNVGLNFQGWRCITASFSSDMGHDKTALTQMTIQAPSSGSGVIYFDHIEFQTSVKWDRMTDAQCKLTQSSAVFDFWGIRSYGNFATVPMATSAEISMTDTIAKRLDYWFLSSGKYSNANEFKSRKSAIDSKISYTNSHLSNDFNSTIGDGTSVTGVGLYPENSPGPFAGVAVRNFSDVSTGSMLWLAYDFKLNNKTSSKTRWINLIDWFSDQGWADGSAMAGLMGEKLRSAGYFNSIFMMRNELDTMRLRRELGNLNWFGLWGNTTMPFLTPGENADQIRTMCIAKLAYALMQPDVNKRVAAMKFLSSYFNNAFAIAPGFLETFKPDFSGYHHSGTYFTQYYPDALYTASWVCYLLHNTPYALSDTVYSTLKNCLLNYRLACSLYDSPVATCGRFPTGTQYLDEITPAFAYLALSKSTPDIDLLAAFGRLWKPTVSPLKDDIANAATSISLRTTLGETELCLQAISKNIQAEANPKTALYLPYSGLLIHRDLTRHLSIKGFSKYVWDFEADASNNIYGRYASYGQIDYTNLTTTRRNNNYENVAWDWSRIPGTTTKYLPKTALLYTSGSPYRNFSDNIFLGGASLNDSTSMFSMTLHDNTFDNSFYANKSVFCFGNVLVCLGSKISNNDNSNRTETTLMQQVVKKSESLQVNGTALSVTQTRLVQPIIRDNIGNRFIVKSGAVDVVKTDSMFAAVINHGLAPQNQSYIYFMLQLSSDAQESEYSNTATCPISIIRQDNVAHIVNKKDENVRNYAIFSTTTPLNDTWINQVNTPSLVMFKAIDSLSYRLVVSDPDMHRLSAQNSDALSSSAVSSPSGSYNYEIILNGLFTLYNSSSSTTLTNNGNTTKIALTVIDGKSYSIGLKKISTGIGSVTEESPFIISNTEIKNVFQLKSSDNEEFNCTVFSIDGKTKKENFQVKGVTLLNLQDYQKGLYIVDIQNKKNSLSQKILIQ